MSMCMSIARAHLLLLGKADGDLVGTVCVPSQSHPTVFPLVLTHRSANHGSRYARLPVVGNVGELLDVWAGSFWGAEVPQATATALQSAIPKPGCTQHPLGVVQRPAVFSQGVPQLWPRCLIRKHTGSASHRLILTPRSLSTS